MGKLILSELFLLTPFLKVSRERQFHFDVGNFLFGKIKEILNGSYLPSGLLKLIFFSPFHCLVHFIIGSESGFRGFDYIFGRFLCLFAEHIRNYNCIRIDSVYDSPCSCSVNDSQFMASSSNSRHRARMRKTKLLTELKPAEQEPCFQAGHLSKGRSFHLAFKPGERLAFVVHPFKNMSYMTYCQVQ